MENKFWIWFSRIKKLTCIQKEYLINQYGSPEKIWEKDYRILKQDTGFDDESIYEITNPKYRKDLDKYVDYMVKNNIRIVTFFDERYPKKLKEIYDKPMVLYAKGNLELLEKKCVAIVGSRNCSYYGKTVAQNLSYNLSKENICIVSGLAKGVDSISHKSALDAGGSTIAVMGCGLDYIYPYENKDLYERILENNSLIVTEYIIGTKPERLNFPARNRIISALSDAIVVVEATEKSGALITAEFGLEHGKDVFAVPGNITSDNSKGTNKLIKDGANVLIDYKDIL